MNIRFTEDPGAFESLQTLFKNSSLTIILLLISVILYADDQKILHSCHIAFLKRISIDK